MMAERIGIVVLAAGAATRFGASKLTVPIDGVPLVRRAALAALGASAHVVVITGAHRAAVESCIADLAVERVFNPGWADGIGGSIACGVAALSPSCDATIIALGDQALIGSDEFRALIAAHARAPGRIIAATYADVVGPPCLFPPALFGELIELAGDRGARMLLRRHSRLVDALPMACAAVDIDTVDDAARFERPA